MSSRVISAGRAKAGAESMPLWQVWLSAARPKTLSAGAVPVLFAAALALPEPGTRWSLLGFIFLSALAIQIGTNFYNDYADGIRGTDVGRAGPARAVDQGQISPEAMRRGAHLAFAAAFLFGLPLVLSGGWPILLLGLVSILCGYLYTGGPAPLAYVGLGDLFVFLFFGLAAVTGTHYLLTGHLRPESLWVGALCGLLSTGILVVNNTRDRIQDAKHGKRTLAVRLGRGFSQVQYTLCIAGAYAILGLLAPKNVGAQAALWTAPLGVALLGLFWRRDGAALNPLLGMTGALLLLVALVFFGATAWTLI